MGLPIPKFAEGQTVWFYDTKREAEYLPCPDCMGAKVWKVETPAGLTYDTPCQRCEGGHTYSRHDEVVPLAYTVWSAAIRPMTITGIDVRSKGDFGEGPQITYWAGNSGRQEDAVWATEAEAAEAAAVKVGALNATERATPECLAAKNIGKLTLDKALYDQFANGLWNAWYAYRSLVEAVESGLDGYEQLNAKELSDFRDGLKWDVEYREGQNRPLDVLVAAVRDALEGDDTKLAAAYEALPLPLRKTYARQPVEDDFLLSA